MERQVTTAYEPDNYTQVTQENILAMLLFDERMALIIRGRIDVGLFDSKVYETMAKRAAEYIDEYHAAPGRAHIKDILQDKLKEGSKQANVYQFKLGELEELSKVANRDYILGSLNEFNRHQRMKQASVQGFLSLIHI